MKQRRIKIWDALNDEEADAKEIDVEVWDASSMGTITTPLLWAVESFVDGRWASNDYPETTEINVRMPDGRLIELVVYAEQIVQFRACPRNPS